MFRTATLLVTFVILFSFLSCTDDTVSVPAESELTNEAQSTIGAIYNNMKMYRQENGEDPASVEELITEGYLEIDPEVEKLWLFRLIGRNPVTQIYAESTPDFPRGVGYTIVFDVQTGLLSGYGQDRDLWLDLFCTINSIKIGAEQYLAEHSRQPATFDILHDNGYVHIHPALLLGREFMLIHNENKLVSIYSVEMFDLRTIDFNLIIYHIAEDRFETFQIDDAGSKRIMRVMPEIMKGIFLHEAEYSRKPSSFNNIRNFCDFQRIEQLWDHYSARIVQLEKNYQIEFWDHSGQGRNIDQVIRFILPAGRFAGGGFPGSDLTDIMAAFAEVYKCLENVDHGYVHIQDLIDDYYLFHSQDVIDRWDFFLDYNGSEYGRINAVAKDFSNDYSFHFATLKFESESEMYPAQFSTSVAVDPDIRPFVGEIMKIIDGIYLHRAANMVDAASVEELEEEGYVDLDPEFKNKWVCSLRGSNPVVKIEAISTEALAAGAGHVMFYDFISGEFSGYGMELEADQ